MKETTIQIKFTENVIFLLLILSIFCKPNYDLKQDAFFRACTLFYFYRTKMFFFNQLQTITLISLY